MSGGPAAEVDASGLLLAAAREVAPDAGEGRDPGAADAWRDAAVRHALAAALAAGDGEAVLALATGYDALLLRRPDRHPGTGEVLLQAAGNGERRHRGAFSTPPRYAASLARRALPAAGPAGPVVDPACGTGALLRAALSRLLELGADPAAAAAALHGVDVDPVAVELCRAALATDLCRAGLPCTPVDLAGSVVAGDALAPGGLDWPAVFGAVLARPGEPPERVTGWRGGFGAVLANPPWERLKVHARDWAGAPPGRLRADRAASAQALRDGGRHPLTGVGELNAYLPFVETCWRLLAPHGLAAVLVPAGIASDRSAAGLLEALAAAGSLRRLHLLEPDGPVFTGVSGRLGLAVVELRGGPPRTGRPAAPEPAEVAVGLRSPDEPPGERAWPLAAELLRVLNPNTGTAPLFGSVADARIVTAVHRRTPILLRHADPDRNPWGLRLITPLHMTRDAPRFATAPGDGLLPLWEAKHVGLLDPFGGGRAGPRYWVPEELMRARHGELLDRGWLAGYRNVATTASARTLVPSPLPVAAVGNSLPLIDAPRLPLLLAALAALPTDYLIRQKHAGANLNFFKLEQLLVPAPWTYDEPAPWAPERTAGDWVLSRFARAVAWAPGLAGLAAELRAAGIDVPEAGNGCGVPDLAARRAALAELDAAHAILLGLDREDLLQLLSTFGALREREGRVHGAFVTADAALAAFDRLTGRGRGRAARRRSAAALPRPSR